MSVAVNTNLPVVDMDGTLSQASASPCVSSTPLHPCSVERVDTSDLDESLSGEHTWAIDNFSKMKQAKLYSPVFQSGQYNWYAKFAVPMPLLWRNTPRCSRP